MSSGDVEIEPINKLHLRVIEDTAIYHFLDSIEKQLDMLSGAIGIAQDQFQVNNALGTSLDGLGRIFDILREDGTTDTAFRTMLTETVPDIETQTKELIEDTVENITGYPDSVDEYPDVDFVVEYGLANQTAIRIQLPANLGELYAPDVHLQIDRLKAAGVAVVVESLASWFEAFTDVITVEDLLLNYMFAYFDETIAGWPSLTEEGWDIADWDDGTWDAPYEQPSDYFEWFFTVTGDDEVVSVLTEALLFGVLFLFLESLTTTDDVILLEGVFYLLESITAPSLVDILVASWAEPLTESLPTPTELLLFLPTFILSELITTFTDEMLQEGILYYTESMPTVVTEEDFVSDPMVFEENVPNSPYAKIDSALIDTDVLAPGVVLSGSPPAVLLAIEEVMR